jgi:hypothetical protein
LTSSLLGQKRIIVAGDHINNGVADANDIVTGFAHEGFLMSSSGVQTESAVHTQAAGD